jgi:hypothetical protein
MLPGDNLSRDFLDDLVTFPFECNVRGKRNFFGRVNHDLKVVYGKANHTLVLPILNLSHNLLLKVRISKDRLVEHFDFEWVNVRLKIQF